MGVRKRVICRWRSLAFLPGRHLCSVELGSDPPRLKVDTGTNQSRLFAAKKVDRGTCVCHFIFFLHTKVSMNQSVNEAIRVAILLSFVLVVY
jgi:hypothetical protein